MFPGVQMSKPRVAVIGGGALGAAAAYHLARSGAVVSVLESGVAGGEGASRHSGGIVRSFDLDPVLARLSAYGTWLMHHWNEHEWPGQSPFKSTGLYYLLDGDDEGTLSQALHAASVCGFEMRVRGTREAPAGLLTANASDRNHMLFDPSAGLGDVRLTIRNLISGVLALGGNVFEHCRVQCIRPASTGGVDVVLHSGQPLAFDFVLVAAGWMSRELMPAAQIAAKTIPMLQLDGLPGDFLIPLIDAGSGAYLRPLGPGQALLGWSGTSFDWRQAPPPIDAAQGMACLAALSERVDVGQPRVINALQGIDAYTANCRPMVGFLHDPGSIYLATGLSGRGYKFSLALGRLVSRAIGGHLGLHADGMEDHPIAAPLQAEVVSELNVYAAVS